MQKEKYEKVYELKDESIWIKQNNPETNDMKNKWNYTIISFIDFYIGDEVIFYYLVVISNLVIT